jgi:ribosomal protein S18 acetylase RimI-like enzyme
MATRIRRARPDDAPFLARVMLTASRGHVARGAWDVYVADAEPRVLGLLAELAVQATPSFCRWDGVFVAEVDGVAAAALSGYDSSAPGMADPDPAIAIAMRTALGWGEAERRAADVRLQPFVTCLTAPPPHTWVIEWVATDAAFRRRGLVRELLDTAMAEGRRRRIARSHITLFVGNTAAQCAYERAGYAAVGDKRHPAFEALIGCPGLLGMARDLGAV